MNKAIPVLFMLATTLNAHAQVHSQTQRNGELIVRVHEHGADHSVVRPISVVFEVGIEPESDWQQSDISVVEPDWGKALPDELTIETIGTPMPGRLGPDAPFPIESWQLQLVALAPGEYEIASIELVITTPDTSEPVRRIVTEPFTITVESVLTEIDTDLADIKDPIDPPPDYAKIALYVGGGVLAAALLAAGIAVMARRRPEIAPEPPTPAHVTALAEIDALLATDLIERRRWKAYFGELSGVLRRYIERRFDLHAPTQTTEEFLRDPRMTNMFEPAHDALVRGFLGQADMVKFAEGAMDASGAREAAERVRAFVEETGIHSAHEEATA